MPLHERDIFHFVDVTMSYLNKMTSNEISLRDPTIEFQSLVFSAYTGLIHVQGEAEGFVYVTASQLFLQHLHSARHGRSNRPAEESCREAMTELTDALVHQAQKKLGQTLRLDEARVFSTVPDDPIEMPPAVFVQPLLWRKEHAYLVLGLSSPETP